MHRITGGVLEIAVIAVFCVQTIGYSSSIDFNYYIKESHCYLRVLNCESYFRVSHISILYKSCQRIYAVWPE